MSENDEEKFVPRSDEELAQMLESQLAAMRSQTAEQARTAPAVEDPSLDEIFGALLEDATNPIDVPVATTTVEPVAITPSVVEPDETQPITFVSEMAVATTISTTATSIPVPSMFGEAEYVAAVLEEAVAEGLSAPLALPLSVAVTETRVEKMSESHVDAPPVTPNSTNPIVTFEPRPSFDELVFGVSSED